MEIQDYFNLLKRRWWIPTLLALVLGVLGFILTPQPVTRYRATTQVLVNQGADEFLPEQRDIQSTESFARTYAEFMRQPSILSAVVTNLGLDLSPSALAGMISVGVVPDTNILRVQVIDNDPERAAAVANEVVTVFIEQNTQIESSRYTQERQTIEEELTQLEAEMRDKRLQSLEIQLTIDNVQDDIRDIEQAESVTPAQETELQQLQDQFIQLSLEREDVVSDLDQLESRVNSLYSSLEQLRLDETRNSDFMTVIQPAERGSAFSEQSRKPIVAAQSALAGMVVGFGIIFLSEQLRTVIRSGEEVERIIGEPTLGFIMNIKGAEGEEKLVAANEPRSPVAEAYRVIRTNVDFAGRDGPIRTLLVTSSSPAEGKTLTTANLAATMAYAGKRVILVDTDLRRPSLHKLFNVSNSVGVTTAISRDNDSPLTDHIGRTPVENLYIMPSGPLPPNPADILGGEGMRKLINELRDLADMVIFDSPPVLAVADPTLLAQTCDATLLVVLSNSTRIDALRKVRDRLDQSGANVIGAVLNRISTSDNGYYQYYYYGHGE